MAMAIEEFRLDTALYIGIAVDILLAIIAGVLIYKWRKRANEKAERARQIEGLYGLSQRTETETIQMDPVTSDRDPSQNTPRPRGYEQLVQGQERRDYEKIEGNFGFQKNHPSPPGDEMSNGDTVSRQSRVNFSDIAVDNQSQEADYPYSVARQVQNPLAANDGAFAASADGVESPESASGDMAVSTYYTYKPPKKQLDGESSEVMTDGEISPTASVPPPLFLDLQKGKQEDDENESPPPPPPDRDGNEYSYIDCEVAEDESGVSTPCDRASTTSWSTANFGHDEVYKLYNIELEESTPIL